MDYIEKIKLATNYKELNDSNNGNIMTIPYIYFPSDDQLKGIKREREKKISEILDDSPTENDIWGLSDFEEGVISPKIESVNVTCKIKTEKAVWDDLVSKFNNITNRPYHNKFRSNYNLNIAGKDIEVILRELVLKINMISNHIVMESRIGPAKSIIISNDLEYLVGMSENLKKMGLNIIIEENLNPKTIIVLRNGLPDTEGIIMIREGENWWEHSTPNWLKNIGWFNVI